MRCALAFVFLGGTLFAEQVMCPSGQSDMMKYFVMAQANRADHFMSGTPNPIYTEVFLNEDFVESGYWFWLKSPQSHGFDVKAFDQNYIYMRSTELVWTNNTSFKRFIHDLPIASFGQFPPRLCFVSDPVLFLVTNPCRNPCWPQE
jgi:hypothetical protein